MAATREPSGGLMDAFRDEAAASPPPFAATLGELDRDLAQARRAP